MAWQIEINREKTEVRLDLRRRAEDEIIEPEEVLLALKAKKVSEDEGLAGRVAGALAGGEEQPVLVRGEASLAGEDGRFEWAAGCDPEHMRETEAEGEKRGRVSHYERRSIVLVGQGDTIGVLHAPTEGKTGRDVFGQELRATAGREVKVTAGKNVEVGPDGKTFVAKCDGRPRLVGTALSVEPVIMIDSHVDFETGNISFSGSVEVRGDVKDLFEVCAGGDLRIGGTVEGARVQCGGSLEVNRGINGKSKGEVRVGGELRTKYLSNVTAWVRGDAHVNSEIVHGSLYCRGDVVLERGAIHGGMVTARGSVAAPELGSEAGVRTEVRVGVDPWRERLLEAVHEKRQETEKQIATLMPRARMILAACGNKPNEELRELAREIEGLKRRLKKLERQERRLAGKLYGSGSRIVVHKTIYPGTVLMIGEHIHPVEHALTGPLEAVVRTGRGDEPEVVLRSPVAAAQTAG